MNDAAEQDLVEPCPAIGARFEPLERTPGLQIDILDNIFCVAAFPRHPQGRPEKIIQVRHGLNLKAFLNRLVSLRTDGGS